MVWQLHEQLAYQDFVGRLKRSFGIITAVFIFLAVQLFIYQVIWRSYYLQRAEVNRTQIFYEPAPRGNIYSVDGIKLAGSKKVFQLLFYPFVDVTRFNLQQFAGELSRIINYPAPAIARQVAEALREQRAAVLSDKIDRTTFFLLKEQQWRFPGLSIIEAAQREYQPGCSIHLPGYLSNITREELYHHNEDQVYHAESIVGRAGLERSYEKNLRGIDGGWQIEVDASGRQKRIVKYLQPVPGDDLYLTINWHWQKIAENALATQAGRPGAVVAIDIPTDAVRVFVSYPSINPDLFVSGDYLNFWSDWIHDKRYPLLNRCTQGLYPPGSTFKVITFLAALQEAKATPDLSFYCPGYFNLGNKTFRCWQKTGHGRLNLIRALAESCNVYFYQLGLRLGIENIDRYSRLFQLDKPTQIDLPSESVGTSALPDNRKVYSGEAINASIGQGYLTATPLRLAELAATIARRGVILRPYLVEKIISPDGKIVYQNNGGTVIQRIDNIEPENWSLLQQAMEQVVLNGTGRAAGVFGVRIAGKTGTAQTPRGKDHAWFIGYAPADKPRLAIAVLVEHGGSGGAVAAPIAAEIFRAASEDKYW